jgi:hypothetical protein
MGSELRYGRDGQIRWPDVVVREGEARCGEKGTNKTKKGQRIQLTRYSVETNRKKLRGKTQPENTGALAFCCVCAGDLAKQRTE